MLYVGLVVGGPIFIKEFLKDKKDCNLLTCISSLFHSRLVYGEYEYFNTSVLQ